MNLNLKLYAQPTNKEIPLIGQQKSSSETIFTLFKELHQSMASSGIIENQIQTKIVSFYSNFGSKNLGQIQTSFVNLDEEIRNQVEQKHLFTEQYEIRKILYQKGNCQVLLCNQKSSNIQRVAKLLKKENTNYQDLISEIKINYKLFNFPHKNIISLIELFIDSDSVALVFDYLQGGTLYDFMKKKNFQLTLQETQQIMKQILKGLLHLHSQNILHRDIKLDNIMFAQENNIKSLKIIDFGCATFDDDFNRKQIKCGTPGYIAPEIYTGAHYDHTCDVYSLGAIFHILLTGTRIFPSNLAPKQIQLLNSQNQFTLNQSIKSSKITEFLKSMLNYQQYRPSAEECLKNEFFLKERKSVRESNQISHKMALLEFPLFKNPFQMK